MQVETSVALGRDDPALEIPWASDDFGIRYFDLRSNPELISDIPEARSYPELKAFLLRVNAPSFFLQTAKTDVWLTDELAPDEDFVDNGQKLVSYVDLVFSADESRFSFAAHERLVQSLCDLLIRAPEIAANVELVIRHCYFHGEHDTNLGFCISAYISGFGISETAARERWGLALKMLQHALVQLAFASKSPRE